MNKLDDTVASDRLSGAKAIGAFTGDPKWKVYQHASKGTPGFYKVGRRIYGSKQVLRQNHQDRARAGATE